MRRTRLALARVNYSQLYSVFDGGKTYRQRDILTPYHLLNLAGFVREKVGADVRIFDAEVDLLSQAALARDILAWQPDVVGFTATTPDIDLAVEVCDLIKADRASVLTVIGGPHARAVPDDVAARASVDYVVIGDGEAALTRIVQERPAPRRGAGDAAGKIISVAVPTDLTCLPLPAHDLLDYDRYQFTDPRHGRRRTATVMSTRGCPFSCTFCHHDKTVRSRTVDAFVDEIRRLYEDHGVRYFFIYDDVFILDKPRLADICRRIGELGLTDAAFQCQVRANLVEPGVIAALREVNVVRASMGVESGSQAMLSRCCKQISKRQCVDAVKTILAQDIEPRASFIIGHPYETRETVRETIAFAKELDLLEANFTVMTPYPGTETHRMALAGEGIRFTHPEYATQWGVYRRWGKPIIETDALSADDLSVLREEAVMEFCTQDKVYRFYRDMFENGNRSRYFYRPFNFAWKRKFGVDIPFWDSLDATDIVEPA